MSINLKPKHRKVLSGCVIASLFLHASALGLLHRHSLWLPSALKSETASVNWLNSIERNEREQILKEAFEDLSEASIPALKPREEQFQPTPLHASFPKPAEDLSLFIPQILFQNQFPLSELLAANRKFLPSFSPPEPTILNLFEHLPKELIVLPSPQLAEKANPSHSPSQLPIAAAVSALNSDVPQIQQDPLLYPTAQSETSIALPSFSSPTLPTRAPNTVLSSALSQLPTLAELETASYSDSFESELVFLPNQNGEGYIFALTLIPKPDLELPKIRQHYSFLIDRSNSIQRERLLATKAAVHKALDELEPEDTFNIIVFDAKIDKLSPTPLPYTPESLANAEAFLEKINLGSFFSPADLYKPLVVTIPGTVKEDEIYTAILLTDGEYFAKKTSHRAILYDWTYYNSGKVALFPLGMSGDPHLAKLDTAAAFNKGKLTHSPTKRGLKRKLLKLMKAIHAPIAKNLVSKAISRSRDAKIEIFPKTAQMPNLYLDQPYVIIGTTNTLEDFIIFVQGRLKEGWLNVKKTVSFLNAKKGGQSLKSEWALQRAYELYEDYLIDNDSKHIAEAHALLEPFELQSAFE